MKEKKGAFKWLALVLAILMIVGVSTALLSGCADQELAYALESENATQTDLEGPATDTDASADAQAMFQQYYAIFAAVDGTEANLRLEAIGDAAKSGSEEDMQAAMESFNALVDAETYPDGFASLMSAILDCYDRMNDEQQAAHRQEADAVEALYVPFIDAAYGNGTLEANGTDITYEAGVGYFGNGYPMLIVEIDGNTLIYLDKVDAGGNLGTFGAEDAFRYTYTGNEARIYVGSNNKAVTGDTNITMLGGNTEYIYGGGYNTSGTVGGNTHVTLTGGTVQFAFGGGYNAPVTGNTNVTLNRAIVTNAIYGGGHNTSGTVGGDTNVTLTSGTVNSVYGGGYNAAVTGNTNVTLNGETVSSNIYGGAGGTSGTVGKDANVTLTKGSVSSVYGWGSTGTDNVTGTQSLKLSGDVKVTGTPGIDLKTFNNASGKSKLGGFITGALTGTAGTISITPQSTDADSVLFTGSSYTVQENDYKAFKVVTEDFSPKCLAVKNNTIIVSADITYELYGTYYCYFGNGYPMLIVEEDGKTQIYLDCEDASGNLGTFGEEDEFRFTYKDNTGIIFGGSNAVALTSDTHVTMLGGTVYQVFGGCSAASMTGNAYVTLNGGTVLVTVGGGTLNSGNIYGDTHVTLSGVTINGYVYGGSIGGTAETHGSTYVIVNEGTKVTRDVNATGWDTTTGSTNLTVNGGEITGTIYGGCTTDGRYVGGNAIVTLNGGSIGGVSGWGGNAKSDNVTGTQTLKLSGDVKVTGTTGIDLKTFDNTSGKSKQGGFVTGALTGKVGTINITPQSTELESVLFTGDGYTLKENDYKPFKVVTEGFNPKCLAVKDNTIIISTDITYELRYDSISVYGYFGNGFPMLIVEEDGKTKIYLDCEDADGKLGTFGAEDGLRYTYTGNEADIYGGSNNKAVATDTNITMLGGSASEKSVYGGGYGSDATVTGVTNVTLTKGTVNYVYGGGSSAPVASNTNLTLNGATVSQNIYGGGQKSAATVGGNTTVTLTSGTVQSAYGGGASGAPVTGNTNVNLKGATVSYEILGGGSGTGATVGGDATVTLTSGGAGNVYGGGAAKSKVTGNTNVTLDDATITLSIYGGGSGTDASVGKDTKVTLNGGTVQNVYGGGRVGAPVTGNTNVTLNGTTVSEEIYGGGNGTGSTVGADTHVTLTDGTAYKVYGGGSDAPITGNTEVTLNGATVSKNIYGGGFSAGGTVGGNTKVTLTKGKAEADVYGGGYSGAKVNGSTDVTLNGATAVVAYIYGGGKGTDSTVVGDTNVTLTKGKVNYVYGGGNGVSVTGSTNVTLNGASVGECLYGGGIGTCTVGKDTNVTLTKGTVKYVLGWGNFGALVTGTQNLKLSGNVKVGDAATEGSGIVLASFDNQSCYDTVTTKNNDATGTKGVGGFIVGALTGEKESIKLVPPVTTAGTYLFSGNAYTPTVKDAEKFYTHQKAYGVMKTPAYEGDFIILGRTGAPNITLTKVEQTTTNTTTSKELTFDVDDFIIDLNNDGTKESAGLKINTDTVGSALYVFTDEAAAKAWADAQWESADEVPAGAYKVILTKNAKEGHWDGKVTIPTFGTTEENDVWYAYGRAYGSYYTSATENNCAQQVIDLNAPRQTHLTTLDIEQERVDEKSSYKITLNLRDTVLQAVEGQKYDDVRAGMSEIYWYIGELNDWNSAAKKDPVSFAAANKTTDGEEYSFTVDKADADNKKLFVVVKDDLGNVGFVPIPMGEYIVDVTVPLHFDIQLNSANGTTKTYAPTCYIVNNSYKDVKAYIQKLTASGTPALSLVDGSATLGTADVGLKFISPETGNDGNGIIGGTKYAASLLNNINKENSLYLGIMNAGNKALFQENAPTETRGTYFNIEADFSTDIIESHNDGITAPMETTQEHLDAVVGGNGTHQSLYSITYRFTISDLYKDPTVTTP